MGSPKDAKAPASLPNSKPAASSSAAPPPPPPEASPSAWLANSAHWAASAQAYYSAGAGTQPAFFLPIWGGQHLIPLCGTPIASPMYASSAVYVRPSIDPGMGYLAGESMKSKGGPEYFVGGNETSCSGEEEASQSDGGAKDDPYDSRDVSPELQGHFKDAIQVGASPDKSGEASQLATAARTNNTAESTFSGRGRAPKFPALVPQRIRSPAPGNDMDIWNAPHVGGAPLNVGRNTVIAPVEIGFNGAMAEHYHIQDEHKLKREKRKLHNRESSIRSRLRKQQKTQELARKVAKLKGENAELRIELEQLHKVCKDLEAENQHISGRDQ